ncbi:MAG: sulfotransferase family 2 domain-containing protein [Parahaliea sp.]
MNKRVKSTYTGKSYPQRHAEEDFVFFLHIPKTAGTSVANALQPLFAKDKTLTHKQMNAVRFHDPSIFLSAKFFHGHFTYDVYAYRLPKQPDFILTFLRDPVAHYISMFFHLKIDPTFIHDVRLLPDMDLAREFHQSIEHSSIEAFFKHDLVDMFDNFQTRYLVRGLSDEYDGLDDIAQLPIAQKLLLNLPYFGITEYMSDSLRLLEYTMAAPCPLTAPQTNLSRNKPKNYALSEEILTEITRRTSVDSKLYKLARKVFADRCLAAQIHIQPPA